MAEESILDIFADAKRRAEEATRNLVDVDAIWRGQLAANNAEIERLRAIVDKLQAASDKRAVIAILEVARDADDGMMIVYTGCISGMPPKPSTTAIACSHILMEAAEAAEETTRG